MSEHHVLEKILGSDTSLPSAQVVRHTDLRTSDSALHICFHCGGELVFPLDWREEDGPRWRILLRCPDCESRREGVFDQPLAENLDDELDRAAGKLLRDLREVARANMLEEIEFFVRALDADLITPQDF